MARARGRVRTRVQFGASRIGIASVILRVVYDNVPTHAEMPHRCRTVCRGGPARLSRRRWTPTRRLRLVTVWQREISDTALDVLPLLGTVVRDRCTLSNWPRPAGHCLRAHSGHPVHAPPHAHRWPCPCRQMRNSARSRRRRTGARYLSTDLLQCRRRRTPVADHH